jgi:predicted MPP superfamily phosphohydrolase
MRKELIFLIITVLLLAADLYAFQAVKTSLRDSSNNAKRIGYIVYWSFTFITVATILSNFIYSVRDWPNGLRSIVFSIIALAFLGKLFIIVFLIIDDFQRFIRWIASMVSAPADSGPTNIGRAKFLSQTGIVIATAPLIAGLWGIFKGAHDYTIHRVKITLPNLPDAFNGLKIVQLSDIHAGSFPSANPLKLAVDMVNKENADLLFFTGDLVNNITEEVLPYVSVFGQMNAKMGKYSVFGNHDYGDYVGWDSKEAKLLNIENLKKAHGDMGWRLLWDEHVYLEKDGQRIALIGVQNCSGTKSFHTYGDLDKAYKGCEAPVKLLLSHDPTFWDAKIRDFEDIDITFAGHTHGAQFGIEWGKVRWSPAQYIYKQWAGLYQKGKQYIYVNRGFGYLGFPGRIGILPEITVMTLVKE